MSHLEQGLFRTGWYYRVIEAGRVELSSTLNLIERPCPKWPLVKLFKYLYEDTLNSTKLEEMASLPFLADSWRDLVIKRINSGTVENWEPRLVTPQKLQF